MREEHEPRPTINKVFANNYRSLVDLQLDLGPLTVLVGPNASGKSSIVDVIRFVLDAVRNDLEFAIDERHGISAIRRWSAKGRPYDIEIGLDYSNGEKEFEVEYKFALGSKRLGEYSVKREYAKVQRYYQAGRPFEFEVKSGVVIKPKVSVIDGDSGQMSLDLFEPPEPVLEPRGSRS